MILEMCQMREQLLRRRNGKPGNFSFYRCQICMMTYSFEEYASGTLIVRLRSHYRHGTL
jgi:hypothetical protein